MNCLLVSLTHFSTVMVVFLRFMYLFMVALGLGCCAWLSLVAVSRGYSLLRCLGSSLWWLLLLPEHGLQELRHLGSVVMVDQA